MAVAPGFDLDVSVGAVGPTVELDGSVVRNRPAEPNRVVVSRLEDKRSVFDPRRCDRGREPVRAELWAIERLRERCGLWCGGRGRWNGSGRTHRFERLTLERGDLQV